MDWSRTLDLNKGGTKFLDLSHRFIILLHDQLNTTFKEGQQVILLELFSKCNKK